MFDDQKRLELSNSVPDAVFDENYKAKYQEFLEYGQSGGDYLNWYTGLSSINLPNESSLRMKIYESETASLTLRHFKTNDNKECLNCELQGETLY